MLAIAEHSAVLNDAKDAAGIAHEQLQLEREKLQSEKEKVAKMKIMIQEVR